MYKLFLTLRYLTRKKIVIFPILVVWLCLMMMIIVTSIMGGFADRVRQANRDLLGDIIISSHNPAGWPYYDELAKHLKNQFPEIQASTPVIHAYGLAYFLEPYNQTVPVQVIGIRPGERAKVSRFRETLFRQYLAATQVADDLAPGLPASKPKLVDYAEKKADNAALELQKARADYEKLLSTKSSPAPNLHALWALFPLALILFLIVRPRPLRTFWSFIGAGVVAVVGLAGIALVVFYPIINPHQFELAEDHANRAYQDRVHAYRTAQYAHALPDRTYQTKHDLLNVILPPEPSFDIPPDAQFRTAATTTTAPDQDNGCIVGVQLGLFERDKRGNFQRSPVNTYPRMRITVFPVKESGAMGINASVTLPFTMVDDSYSGVFDVDSTYVYAPFDTVQQMTRMAPDPEVVKENPEAKFPPRTHDLLIKLKGSVSANDTRFIREKMQHAVEDFQADRESSGFYPLKVQTWDERQAKYLGLVENEKYMQFFILGLMSLVVLVVIFLIFYMIVRDKTRDIGILKAVGGSELGVLSIFLNYGLFIGIVGGGLGVISGYLFVTHTNEIHEWIYQFTGVVIWDRSVYLFDRIPDKVNYTVLTVYYTVAIIAGLIGAMIPASFAALEDPVKAVRYE